MSKFSIGDELSLLDKPDGDFVWQDSDNPTIFIAGGIGVTPFYSILKQRVHDNLPLKTTLIYVSRTDEVPFKADFNQWVANDSNFKVYYEVGAPMTVESLAKMRPDINNSLVYLSGPEPMVETLGNQLKEHGLPEVQLKQDFFPNYSEKNY